MPKVLIELFTKASANYDISPSACPFSQRWFMVFYHLVEHQLVDLRVINVSTSTPPQEYTDLFVGTQLPAVAMYDGAESQLKPKIYSGNDELENMVREYFGNYINVDSEVQWIGSDVLRDLNSLLRSGQQKALLMDLSKLDTFIANSPSAYLENDNLSYTDCSIAPKLQHVRVAAEFYRNFVIPHELIYLWSYISKIYSTPAFKQSCPMDRDLLLHSLEKVDIQEPNVKKEVERMIFNIPEHQRSISVPSDYATYNSCESKETVKLHFKSKLSVEEFNTLVLPELLREATMIANDASTTYRIF